MDELFTRYMYFLRAKEGNKSTTTEALRKFYERNKYQYFKRDNTIGELKALASFWDGVLNQDQKRFSVEILKKLFVLSYAPNGMWQNITSVYFLQNSNDEGELNEENFSKFLSRITAFIFAYAVTNPGVNALRTPVYDEMVNIVKGNSITFSKYKFNEKSIRASFQNYVFTNQRNVTRSMITWYAFTFPNQQLLDVKDIFHLEHIYARKRYELEGGLEDKNNLASLGNKILLEASINIRASDYHFEDKKKIYTGEQRRGKNKEPSKVSEIMENLVICQEFNENQITERNTGILDGFFEFLKKEELIATQD